MAKKKVPDLIEQAAIREAIRQLKHDLREAEETWDAANLDQAPYAAAFWEAHRFLAELPLQPETPKAERLAAYDRRMAAGHAWFPHKTRLRNAERWIREIERELKNYEQRQ